MRGEREKKGIPTSSPDIYILTRFAEKIQGKESNLLSSEWIENQCRFLENYARPSVENQSDQNFKWLVSVSEMLTPENVQMVSKAIEPIGTLVTQRGDESSAETFSRFLPSAGNFYLTIRFDSDDVLHPSFVRESRQHYDEKFLVFSFVNGYVYDLDHQIAGHWPHKSNTFLFHRGKGGSNVYALGNHTRAEAAYGNQMKVITTQDPMWMKLTHAHNGWGDKITNVDRPLFGNLVQRNFVSGHFPTRFVPSRDLARLAEFFVNRFRNFLSTSSRVVLATLGYHDTASPKSTAGKTNGRTS